MNSVLYNVLDDESGDFRLDVVTDGLINFATGASNGNYEK